MYHQLYKFSLDDSCYRCAKCEIIFMKKYNSEEYEEFNLDKKD